MAAQASPWCSLHSQTLRGLVGYDWVLNSLLLDLKLGMHVGSTVLPQAWSPQAESVSIHT